MGRVEVIGGAHPGEDLACLPVGQDQRRVARALGCETADGLEGQVLCLLLEVEVEARLEQGMLSEPQPPHGVLEPLLEAQDEVQRRAWPLLHGRDAQAQDLRSS